MARHNELCEGVVDLAVKAFTPFHLRNDPVIYFGRAMKRKKAAPAGAGGTSTQSEVQPLEVTEQKGDLLIQDLWKQRTESVHDMHAMNTAALMHRKKQRQHFYPLVASVDELMGVDATATLKRIASRPATMWKQSYS